MEIYLIPTSHINLHISKLSLSLELFALGLTVSQDGQLVEVANSLQTFLTSYTPSGLWLYPSEISEITNVYFAIHSYDVILHRISFFVGNSLKLIYMHSK